MASHLSLLERYQFLYQALLQGDELQLGYSQAVKDELSVNEDNIKSFNLRRLARVIRKAQLETFVPPPPIPDEASRCFDLQHFMHRMTTGQTNLQDAALMALPGGIYHLTKVLNLSPTNDKEVFLRKYNRKYYTPDCSKYLSKEGCAEKAGLYHDIEAIQTLYQDKILEVLEGAVEGGHLDLVKIYLPGLLESDQNPYHLHDLLHRAIECDRMEIYLYLVSISPSPFTMRQMEILFETAVEYGRLEFYKLLIDSDLVIIRHVGPSYLAARKHHNHLIDEMEESGILNPCEAVEGAAKGGNMCVLKRYVPQLSTSEIESCGHIYMAVKNLETCQYLFENGFRPSSIFYLYGDGYYYIKSLEVFSFCLDHFELSPVGTDWANDELQHIFKQVLEIQKPEFVELVLKHPEITKHEPYNLFWQALIFKAQDKENALVHTEFYCEVAKMLIDVSGTIPDPDDVYLTSRLRYFIKEILEIQKC